MIVLSLFAAVFAAILILILFAAICHVFGWLLAWPIRHADAQHRRNSYRTWTPPPD